MGQGGVRFFLDELDEQEGGRFFRDEGGYLRTEGLPMGWEWFFEDDVQGSEEYCAELLAGIEAIRAGERAVARYTGNSMHLELTRQGATVSCLYAQVPGFLALEGFRALVEACSATLRAGEDDAQDDGGDRA